MTKIDFTNQEIPQDYKLPLQPVKLVDNMNDKEVTAYLYQELFGIYQSSESSIVKEMKKEDLYEELMSRSYLLE